MIWNVKDLLTDQQPKPKIKLIGHKVYVESIAISNDGKMLVSSGDAVMGEKSTIRLWDIATGEQLEIIQIGECDGSPPKVSFRHNGKTIASSDCEGKVFIWDIAKQQKVLEVDGIDLVLFSPDGSLLAYRENVGDSEMMHVWNVNAGNEEAILRSDTYGPADWIQSAAFSPDGTLLTAGSYDQAGIAVWDIKTSKRLIVAGIGGEARLAFSPDGTLLASGHAGAGGAISDIHIWGVN